MSTVTKKTADARARYPARDLPLNFQSCEKAHIFETCLMKDDKEGFKCVLRTISNRARG